MRQSQLRYPYYYCGPLLMRRIFRRRLDTVLRHIGNVYNIVGSRVRSVSLSAILKYGRGEALVVGTAEECASTLRLIRTGRGCRFWTILSSEMVLRSIILVVYFYKLLAGFRDLLAHLRNEPSILNQIQILFEKTCILFCHNFSLIH